MLWIIKGENSYAITACNTHVREGKHQLWVERANGKSTLVTESDKPEEIETMRNAIHFAIEKNVRTLEL